VEVEFYNKDARDVFLSPKSVDLFLIHPPYFKMTNNNEYGGDSNLQIHNLRDQEEFSQSMIKYLKNMEDALKNDGNILLIIPNCHDGILGIADIIKNTNLFIDKIIMWHFGKVDLAIKNQYMANLILQIRKDKNFQYPVPGLNSLVIDQPWIFTDVSKYQDSAFVYDGFPKEISDTLIEAFSKEGDTVADIFGGTGTTIISALEKNRKAIYSDASIDQFNLAKRRVYDTIGYKEKDKNMTKEEAVKIMLDSINADNLALGLQAGLREEDIKMQIEQSQPSLSFMMSNIYDLLKQKEIIA
jgi:DNA modification methylase